MEKEADEHWVLLDTFTDNMNRSLHKLKEAIKITGA